MNIPDYMPVLSHGAHQSPADGACIMEYASFLNGEAWTDHPSCTNEVLAKAARLVNDSLNGERRQELLPLLPRLMGTDSRDIGIDTAITQAAADYVGHLTTHPDLLVADYAAAAQNQSRYSVTDAAFAVDDAGMDLVAFLSALIDAYDKAVGRTAPALVTEDDLRRCAELTGATR